jgi:hypothetical protein
MANALAVLRPVATRAYSAIESLLRHRDRPPRPCYLLSLPPELLLIILRHAVEIHIDTSSGNLSFDLIEIQGPRPRLALCGNARGVVLGHNFRGPLQPALARTCHRLRAETLPLFYGERNWKFFCSRGRHVRVNERPARSGWWLSQPGFTTAAPWLRDVRLFANVRRVGASEGFAPDMLSPLLQVVGSGDDERLVLTQALKLKYCQCAVDLAVEALNAGEDLGEGVVVEGETKAAALVRWLFTNEQHARYGNATELWKCKEDVLCQRCGRDEQWVL